jgi:cell division protein FtsW
MLRAGEMIILIVVALLVFGVVMVNSAGLSILADEPIDLRAIWLGRATALAAVACTMLLIGSLLPVARLEQARGLANPVPWFVIGSVLLLLAVHVPGVGREVNGARRWIEIGPVGFQPSEIVKWGLPVALAWYCVRRPELLRRFWRGFLPPMVVILLLCALIATEDLGTALLIGVVAVAVLVAAGARLVHAALLFPLAALGFAAAVLTSPYRVDRLRAFLDPYQDPQTIGYHVLQSMAAIGGGGLAGRGLGNSVQKFGYLPEDTTDFIFAIVCEELGIVGATVVVCLYGGLLICGLLVIGRMARPFCRLLALGIILTVGFQAAINLAVVAGLAPTKGIALPLLSAGGTGWVLTAFSLGLLVAMDRATRRSSLAVQAQPPESCTTVCSV